MTIYNGNLTYNDTSMPSENTVLVSGKDNKFQQVSTPVTVDPTTGNISTPGTVTATGGISTTVVTASGAASGGVT